MKNIQLMQGDCLERLREIPDNSVDLILTDPPYGTTACKWDSIIPFDRLWPELRRVRKDRAAVVMTGSQPFTTVMIASNMVEFKYCWVWNKKQGGHPLNARRQPLRVTEDVAVFCKHEYRPQMRVGKMRKKGGYKRQSETVGAVKAGHESYSDQYYPISIIEIPNCANKADRVHPTQKPVALMEYLIKTYTNEGETVLDFTMGSGTTGVAAANTGRKFIGIELDPGYFEIALNRIQSAHDKTNQI